MTDPLTIQFYLPPGATENERAALVEIGDMMARRKLKPGEIFVVASSVFQGALELMLSDKTAPLVLKTGVASKLRDWAQTIAKNVGMTEAEVEGVARKIQKDRRSN